MYQIDTTDKMKRPKLTKEQVQEIFLMQGKLLYISLVYDIGIYTVQKIKTRKIYKEFTKHLQRPKR